MANPADLYKLALQHSHTRLVEDLDPESILDKFIEKGFLLYTVIRDIQCEYYIHYQKKDLNERLAYDVPVLDIAVDVVVRERGLEDEIGSTSKKNRAIIETVKSKGPDGYKTFKKCLEETSQGHLADHLARVEKQIKQDNSKKSRAATGVDGQTVSRQPVPKHANQPSSRSTVRQSFKPTQTVGQPTQPTQTAGQPTQPIQTVRQRFQPTQAVGQLIKSITTKEQPTQPIQTVGQPTQPIQTVTQPVQPTQTVGQPIQPITTKGQPTQPIQTDITVHISNTDQTTSSGDPQTVNQPEAGSLRNDAPIGETQPQDNSHSPGIVRQESQRDRSGFQDIGLRSDQITQNSATETRNQNPSIKDEPVVTLSSDATDLGQINNLGGGGDRATLLFSTETYIKRDKCPYDGRIKDLDLTEVKKLIDNCPPECTWKGGSGKVFKCPHYMDLDMEVAFKRIEYGQNDENSRDQKMAVINEMLAARVTHYAIVPLLGMVDDPDNGAIYFMSPYFKRGDLSAIIKNESDQLGNEDRMRILYQIAAAIEYLHSEFPQFRGSVIHRDVKTKNIVIDAEKNARLIDFGLSRELEEKQTDMTLTRSDWGETPGYYEKKNKDEKLTILTDWYNFGVVILELLYNKPPYVESYNEFQGHKKRYLKVSYKDEKMHEVWEDGYRSIADELVVLAEKCLAQDKNIDPVAKLKDLLNGNSISKWTPSNRSKCVICMINPKAVSGTLTQHEGCNLNVCVACMRNSYINPIMCHNCGLTVDPPIGKKWGALLITGWDEEKETEDMFIKETGDFYKLITSKYPLIMGLSEENVHRTKLEELDANINLLCQAGRKKDIDTVVIYYTGHFIKDKGFRAGKEEYMKKQKLDEYVNKLAEADFKTFIVFLDCCCAQSISLPEKDISLMQINASGTEREANFEVNGGSKFTKTLLQGLKGNSEGKICPRNMDNCQACEKHSSLMDMFISGESLLNYMNPHLIGYVPKLHCQGDAVKIAYFTDSAASIMFRLRYKEQAQEITLPNILENQKQLNDMLLTEFIKSFNLPPIHEAEYSDIMAVCVTKGPKPQHVYTLDTFKKIISAWTAKLILYVENRHLPSLHFGPVGYFKEVTETEPTLTQCLDQHPLKEELKEHTIQGRYEEVLKIKVADIETLCSCLPKGREMNCSSKIIATMMEHLPEEVKKGGKDLSVTSILFKCATSPHKVFICLRLVDKA